MPSCSRDRSLNGVVDALNRRYLNYELGDEAQWMELKENCFL